MSGEISAVVELNQWILFTAWAWLCLLAGGSKSLNGYGWIRLYEQCDEVSVQIWWPQSIHVLMPCRWGQNAVSLSSFEFLPFSDTGYVLFYLFRWCVQCRGGRPVRAPEANHQQLCVAYHRAQYAGLLVGPRDYSEWGWGWMFQAFGTYNKREHTKWHPFFCLGDAAEEFIHASYCRGDHRGETLKTKEEQVPTDSTWFYFYI